MTDPYGQVEVAEAELPEQSPDHKRRREESYGLEDAAVSAAAVKDELNPNGNAGSGAKEEQDESWCWADWWPQEAAVKSEEEEWYSGWCKEEGGHTHECGHAAWLKEEDVGAGTAASRRSVHAPPGCVSSSWSCSDAAAAAQWRQEPLASAGKAGGKSKGKGKHCGRSGYYVENGYMDSWGHLQLSPRHGASNVFYFTVCSTYASQQPTKA